MTRIYYYEDDKEAIQLIDDYYYFKYMIKMICDDWEMVVYNDDCSVKFEVMELIENNLNKLDIERLNDILIKLPDIFKWYSDIFDLIYCIFEDRNKNFEINEFKLYLIEKYGNQTDITTTANTITKQETIWEH